MHNEILLSYNKKWNCKVSSYISGTKECFAILNQLNVEEQYRIISHICKLQRQLVREQQMAKDNRTEELIDKTELT